MAYVNKAREGREFWNRLCTLPRYMFLLMSSGKGVQKLEDRCGNWIDVHDAQKIVDDAQKIVDDAQAELAALQEELSTSKRNEHNSEVAYKAAIERQNELREELNRTTEKLIQYEQGFWGRMASKNRKEADGLQQRLTAAEQRNAALEKDLGKVQSLARRTLWLAYCWNDHNFREAHTYAQTAAELSGIKSFEEANKFIESWPQPTESGASE